jgi:UPF0755 protein
VTKFIPVVLFVGLAYVGLEVFRFLSAGPGRADQIVVFPIPPGQSFHGVATDLERQGLIISGLRLRILAKLTRQDAKVKSGEYSLNKGMSPQQILSILVSGKSILYPVTFPEGSNIFEMAEILNKQGILRGDEFLKLVHDKDLIRELLGVDVSSLEGYLYPETYNITRFTPMRELVAAMVQNFKNVYRGLETNAQQGQKQPPLPRHQLVILASMVEKETGAPSERPLIASVFYNRLQKNMRLQSDPTTIYGLWVETGFYKKNLTHDDLLHPTPYNTYTEPKLPFGPIANPGHDALEAVFKPANSEFLYFVSHNDGTHEFTKTFADHTKAVHSFQINPAARAGTSWRDLKKKKAN